MWLSVWSEVQMTCNWSSWCHRQPIISALVKSRMVYTSGTGLPRLYWKKAVKRVLLFLYVCLWTYSDQQPSFNGCFSRTTCISQSHKDKPFCLCACDMDRWCRPWVSRIIARVLVVVCVIWQVVQAVGKSYHRACFRCSCCNECLSDTQPFTVDKDRRLLCLPDYYRYC